MATQACGGRSRNRTDDTSLFRGVLYLLSYSTVHRKGPEMDPKKFVEAMLPFGVVVWDIAGELDIRRTAANVEKALGQAVLTARESDGYMKDQYLGEGAAVKRSSSASGMDPVRLATYLRSVADYVESEESPSRSSVATTLKMALDSTMGQSTTSQCVVGLAESGEEVQGLMQSAAEEIGSAWTAFESGDYAGCCKTLETVETSLAATREKIASNSKIFD